MPNSAGNRTLLLLKKLGQTFQNGDPSTAGDGDDGSVPDDEREQAEVDVGREAKNCSVPVKLSPAGCSASSELDQERFGCRKAFDGVLAIGKSVAWASSGEGVGAWIAANFTKCVSAQQSWAVSVFFNFFNNKKRFFAFFIKLI